MSTVIRVVFELSMPNAPSWNGKWSKEGDAYCIFKEFSPTAFAKVKEKIIGNFSYRWDDGWTALVKSRVIDGAESRKLQRLNKGFCGYDWMVERIMCNGAIVTRKEWV